MPDVAAEQLVEARPREIGDMPGVDAGDLRRVEVDADAVVADLREAGAGHQPHVARADDRDPHHASSASRLWWYQISVRRIPSSTRIAARSPARCAALSSRAAAVRVVDQVVRLRTRLAHELALVAEQLAGRAR